MNSDIINVTPGADFTITFLAQVSPFSKDSGYFDIIFLNNSGEVSRLIAPIESGATTLATPTTGPNGSYEARIPELSPGSYTLSAWYPGSDTHWPALSELTIER